MALGTDSDIVWRFGDRPEDGEAWLANPELLHAYVDFRVGSSEEWRRVTVVSDRWVAAQLREAKSAILPALLVVRQGSAEQMCAAIDQAVRSGGALLAREATILPKDHTPVDW